MSVTQRTFDPDGDLLLRLQYRSANVDTLDAAGQGLADDLAATAINDPASPLSTTGSNVIFTPASSVTIERQPIPTKRSVNMLVSSRHLVLASPIFKAMLQSRLPAGQTTFQPRAEIYLSDDNPWAFEILMNILHNHVGKVPDEIDLEMMTKLSVLVDKYQVWQVMDLYVKMWILKLDDSIPTSYTPDVVSWLSISWVFKLQGDFKKMSRIAQQESTSKLLNAGPNALPIPHTILDKIEATRQSGISRIISLINTMLSKYMSETVGCTTSWQFSASDIHLGCDAMLLGTLIKGLVSHKLWPLPTAPYDGLSIITMAKQVQGLKLLSICETKFYSINNPPLPSHGWVKWFQENTDKVLTDTDGLDLVTPNVEGNTFGVTV